jgi:hypothetical protein
MRTSEPTSSGVYADARGSLIATELADVPFDVARVFVVTGPVGGAERGNHTVNGAQLIVLLGGSIEVFTGTDAEHLGTPVILREPGARILLSDGVYIRYRLPGDEASILVLCERPFVARD